jgi:hypothetical protein
MVDDFLGHEATLNLLPNIAVHNRFSVLDDSVDEPEQTVEPEPELPTPEGKRSRRKSPPATLVIWIKPNINNNWLKNVWCRRSRKSRDVNSTLRLDMVALMSIPLMMRKKRKSRTGEWKERGRKGKKPPKPLSIDNLLNSRKAFYHEYFPHLNKDTKIIDLRAEVMGVLVGLRQTSEEYPISYVPMIRAVHMERLRKVLVDERNDEMLFKK